MEPVVDITSLKQASVTFVVRKVDQALANSLRRVLIAEVPTMGRPLAGPARPTQAARVADSECPARDAPLRARARVRACFPQPLIW